MLIHTQIGCAFALDREFFYEIGSYDTGMDIWGSENVEMAFRVSKLRCNRVDSPDWNNFIYKCRYGCAVDHLRYCSARESAICFANQRIHSTVTEMKLKRATIIA